MAGPLNVKDPRYKGSSWNILIEWDEVEPTWEPVNIIGNCDPVAVVLYGEANKLLDKKGWKYFKKHAKNVPKILNKAQKAKAKSGPRYKYGVRLPIGTKPAPI